MIIKGKNISIFYIIFTVGFNFICQLLIAVLCGARVFMLVLLDNFFNPFLGGPLSKDEDFLHVVTANPILLLSMPLSGDSFRYLDLDDFFPSTRSLWNPQLTLTALGELHAGKVLLHDAYVSSSNILKVAHACSVRIFYKKISCFWKGWVIIVFSVYLYNVCITVGNTDHWLWYCYAMCNCFSFTHLLL